MEMMTMNATNTTCGTNVRNWYMATLWAAAAGLPIQEIPVEQLVDDYEDINVWFARGAKPTWGEVVWHAQRIQNADMSYPIILSETGVVLDGMHRIAKAYMSGDKTIKFVQFEIDPEPDA